MVGSEKKPPSRERSVGLGVGSVLSLSLMIGEERSWSLGIDVQKARRQLNTIFLAFSQQVGCVLTIDFCSFKDDDDDENEG